MLNFDLLKKHTLAQKSHWYFCNNVLGYRADPSIKYYDLVSTHKELCDFLDEPGLAKLILMPRESLKSQIITVGVSLRKLVRDPNYRILIYSDSATKAQGFLDGIKSHIEGKAANSDFRSMYPTWETDPHRGGEYNSSRITIRTRKHQQKEPSIDTGGIESSKVGMHYDLIIFDDIVSDLNVTTKEQMDKVYDCYKKSLSLLKRGGEIIIVGTRWHFGDAYGRILAENKDTGEFKTFVKSARDVGSDGKLIFEDIGMTEQWLDEQRRKQGSYIFSCLYQNSPVDDETALFRVSDFCFYQPEVGFHKNMFITGTCDPAGEGEDYTAITVCGHDKDKNIFILDAVNKHLKPNEIVDTIIKLNYKWGFNRFAVEKNFFKGMLERDFKLAEKEHLSNENYKRFSFNEDIVASRGQRNFNRVLSLQPYHERGQIYFPGSTFDNLRGVFSDLAHQLIQFTVDGSKSTHDDLLMSLAFHIEISKRGGEAVSARIPERSPAWIERDMVDSHNELQRRLPRHRREFYQTSLS